MKEPVWNKFLIKRDKELWDAAGYGTRQGFGERPVILVVDVNYAFTGDRRESILESIKRWPNSCGEDAWNAMRHIKRLLDAARAKGLPVIYTTNDWRPDGWDAASWRWKGRRPREMHPQAEANKSTLAGNEINAEIAPEPQDIIIRKLKPSGFHGTPLTSLLTNFKADSLIVVGTSTSGCVRASVIDAFSENYRVAVVEEGCFDRFWTSHAMNLCDMHAKYADVIGIDETVSATGITLLFHDNFEQNTGWTAENLGATTGDWERGVPVNFVAMIGDSAGPVLGATLREAQDGVLLRAGRTAMACSLVVAGLHGLESGSQSDT